MNHLSRMTRWRIILTGAMLTIYLLVLAMQAHAQDGNLPAILQNEHTIYFSSNETTLSPEVRHRLDKLIRDIRSQGVIHGVRVVGFADRTGTPFRNQKLSQMRAMNVRNYLVSRGIVNASVADTRWFGDFLPATNCPDTLAQQALIGCLQHDRRVEVEFDYTMQLARAQ